MSLVCPKFAIVHKVGQLRYKYMGMTMVICKCMKCGLHFKSFGQTNLVIDKPWLLSRFWVYVLVIPQMVRMYDAIIHKRERVHYRTYMRRTMV